MGARFFTFVLVAVALTLVVTAAALALWVPGLLLKRTGEWLIAAGGLVKDMCEGVVIRAADRLI